jgi:HAD superfamily hydrolase (TIGR01509 family)
VQAIVFDFDGTLVDTETPELTVWQETFLSHGVEMPVGYWANLVGRGAEQEFERPAQLLARLTGKPFNGYEDVRVQIRAIIRNQPLRPGVQSLLNEAREAGLPCAVASSSPHAWVDPGVETRGIADRFQAIVCADDVERAKPFPDLFLAACRRLGTDPSETVAIEDSPNGLAAAKAAGLFAIATPNPVTANLNLSAADLVLPDLSHINLNGIRQALVQRKVRHG